MKGKNLFIVTGLIMALPLMANAQCQTGSGYWGGMMGYGGGLLPFGMLTGLLLWILIIGVGIYLFKQLLRSSEGMGQSRALDIAKERYAKGEINKEEFEEMEKEIKRSR